MRLARIVFWSGGIWGVLVLTPLYFLFEAVGTSLIFQSSSANEGVRCRPRAGAT
jgi:hypothetical protein